MKFIVLSNPYELMFEADKVNSLFKAGVSTLHLRKPNYSRIQLSNLLSQIDPDFHSKIVLHSCYELTQAFSVKGVHVNAKRLDTFGFRYVEWKLLKRSKPHLSLSSSFKGVLGANSHEGVINYAFIGPIFTKYSEAGVKQNLKQEQLNHNLVGSKIPCYALGGMELSSFPKINLSGFDGIVLQSAIWKSTEPIKAFKAIQNYFRLDKQSLAV